MRVTVTSHHPPSIESNVTTSVEEFEAQSVDVGGAEHGTLRLNVVNETDVVFGRGNWSHVEIVP